MPHALFVLAHQDDEIAFAPRMRHLLRGGWELSVAYLTNGIRPEVRDDEARAALACIGVDLARVRFFGFPDGSLLDHLEEALALLQPIADVHEVYCLAWEGGHQDHDASHLVAVAFAMQRKIPCFELPLYHGRGTPGQFFRSFSIFGDGWVGRRITWRENLDAMRLCRFHPSQRRTWLMLLPGMVMRRHEWMRPVSLDRLRAKPHAGRLYYERRFNVSWEEFEAKSRSFVAALLPS
ncbi:MAG TPA: PIG-L family deacetylase [Thermoanaerobaculia bacterium]|nr:PIG-L family deacetylase [Thermoanaerobaculia bacterium]